MKLLAITAAVMLLVLAAGCGGQQTGLLGRLPQGYDAYITIDPDKADLQGLLETLEDNLPQHAIDDVMETDLGFDVFDWGQWKAELGIEAGEIGLIGSADKDFIAFFMPCGDGEKLRRFIEDSDAGEAEYLQMEEYTVIVIKWADDGQIDDLEEALGRDLLSTDELFAEMQQTAAIDDPAVSFVFFEEITDVPILGYLSANATETQMSMAVIVDDPDVEQYSGAFGEGLQSSSICFPEDVMAAGRTTFDMEWLISQYADIAEDSGEDMESVESALPFIGFDSMEEFLGVFMGDFCVAVREIEMDRYGEPEGGEGILAISLTDSDKLENSLSMISAMAGAERQTESGTDVYKISEGVNDFWFFISDDVLYLSVNIEPDEVIGGIKARDFFAGTASSGFMGGAADPDMIADGFTMDRDTEELIQEIFNGRAEFSVAFDGNLGCLKATVGPNALEALIAMAGRM